MSSCAADADFKRALVERVHFFADGFQDLAG
jgi:hypothetical protein